jgi:putative glutathione S-transferase
VDPEYIGNITVPVLFDKQTKRIVNNESSEIIQMLNSEFNSFSATPAQAALNLYPESLKADIDAVNEWIYPQVNNGVYRCGFATAQAPYDAAFELLFQGLDRVESILQKQRYLNSNEQLTLADVRLFTTLIRFDTVYHGHFKVRRESSLLLH